MNNLRWCTSGTFILIAAMFIICHVFPSTRGPNYQEPEDLLFAILLALIAIWLRP